MPTDTFTCAQCGGIFDKARPDEEAKAEAADIFGADFDHENHGAVVCHDCWLLLVPEEMRAKYAD